MHSTGWEKIFANHISGKGLTSRICGELLKLNNNDNEKVLIKMGKVDIFPKKVYKWPINT